MVESGTTHENGPWKAGRESADAVKGIFVQSEDFTHDVRLYVNGDFETEEQRFRYAEEIARRLNTHQGQAS